MSLVVTTPEIPTVAKSSSYGSARHYANKNTIPLQARYCILLRFYEQEDESDGFVHTY